MYQDHHTPLYPIMESNIASPTRSNFISNPNDNTVNSFTSSASGLSLANSLTSSRPEKLSPEVITKEHVVLIVTKHKFPAVQVLLKLYKGSTERRKDVPFSECEFRYKIGENEPEFITDKLVKNKAIPGEYREVVNAIITEQIRELYSSELTRCFATLLEDQSRKRKELELQFQKELYELLKKNVEQVKRQNELCNLAQISSEASLTESITQKQTSRKSVPRLQRLSSAPDVLAPIRAIAQARLEESAIFQQYHGQRRHSERYLDASETAPITIPVIPVGNEYYQVGRLAGSLGTIGLGEVIDGRFSRGYRS